MAQTAADRNLLFGIIALQMDFISRDALIAAMHAWALEKDKPLSVILLGQGALAEDECRLLDSMVHMHQNRHGGDVERSLSALSPVAWLKRDLPQVADAELDVSLGRLADAATISRSNVAESVSAGVSSTIGGRFRILRSHARGGQGEVFVARDTELNREVALKQIQSRYADCPESRSRFLLEAEVTGSLEHPGVIPVYGLGYFDDGRPFYAMRFIRGESLKDAIAQFHQAEGPGRDPGERSLALRRLLRRFVDTCNALAYAHSRGVLHRDLKPGNVMLGPYGETLVVDWGLAKAAGHRNGSSETDERTLRPTSASASTPTLTGEVIGTPAFMSPEQARGELDQLSPRSDVYSLGATLYALLTGRPPVQDEDLGEALRKVQRGDFVPPRSLDPAIDPALAAVCKKAMALKPEDRYETCRALADDVEQWMADEPVIAWREPWSRRARRWARRNRTKVTATAAALVAGVVGLAAVLAVQTRAKADLAESLTRETTAKTALAQTNADLIRSQAAVEARYILAVEAIKTFHTGVSEDFLLKQEQFKHVRDQLLTSASDFYGKLGALLGKESDLASRRALWQMNYDLAGLTRDVGTPADALAAHRQVLAARLALAAETPAEPEIKVDVARSLMAVAYLLQITGQTPETELTYRKAEALLVELVPTIAEAADARGVLARCRSALGWVLHTTGRDKVALSVYRLARADQEALAATPGATRESRRDLADTITRLAILLTAMGKPSEAEAEYRNALAIREKLADDNPAVTQFRGSLAQGHLSLGSLLSDTGKSSPAEAEYKKALEIDQKLADDNPAVIAFRNDLGRGQSNLGLLLSNLGRSSEAEAEFKKALATYQKLAGDNPAVAEFRHDLGRSHNNLGVLLSNLGRSSEAETEYREALALCQKLADDNPAVPQFQRDLARGLLDMGWQLAQSGKNDEAIGYYTQEEAIRQKLAQASSATHGDRDSLANCQTNTADVLRRSGRLDEALAACDRSLSVREPLVEANPEIPAYRAALGETYLRLGQVRCEMDKLAGAAAAWKRACAHYDGTKPLNGEHTFLLACCHAGLAGLAGRSGSGVSAAEGADQAEMTLAVLDRAVTMGYRSLDAYRTESALNPLRNRPDFRALLMDLAFPAHPFAP
jgi:eukaryotic-like serine/threonine-protein kinase